MLDIREPTADDAPGVVHVGAVSFNSQPRAAEDLQLSGLLCAFEGNKVVATARAVPFEQWFGGRRATCAGIAGVAVLPEYRGSGAASALVGEMLARCRSQGFASSVLYPANSPLYRRLGYEVAGLRAGFRVPVTDLPPGEVDVREMGDNDLPDVMACFSRFAAGHNGPVQSSDPSRWRDHVLAHDGEGKHHRTVLARGDGRVDGYVSYFLGDWEADGYTLTCKHLVANSPVALRALLGYLRRFESSARDIAWYGPPSLGTMGAALGSNGFSVTPALRRWMARALDVPQALGVRGYGTASGEVVLAIDDPLFPENAGPWRVEVHDGTATVRPAGLGGGVRPIPVGLFSALYTGLLTPVDLVILGTIDSDDPRIPVLSALFAGPVPWMPDFF